MGDYPAFDRPRLKELCGILERKALKWVCKKDFGDKSNVLGGRFVFEIKNMETYSPSYKSIFVVQEHTDCENNMLVHSGNTIIQHSVRLLIALEAVFGFLIWSQKTFLRYIYKPPMS